MRRLAAALLLLLSLTAPAAAQVVTVRSGEHPGFSRLVLEIGRGTEWRLGREGQGYRLQVERPGWGYDIAGVFRLIPRSRLTALAAEADGLRLTVAPGVHAIAFETGTGALALDIRDGAAPAGSPFEAPLMAAGDAAPPRTTAASPYRPELPEDPRLALYWREVAGAGAPERREDHAAPAAATPAPASAREPETPAAHSPAPAAASSPANALPATALPATDPPVPGALSLPDPPDPRVAAAEADLMLQLSRAAAQGLIEVNVPRPDPHALPHGAAAAGRPPEPETADESPAAPAAAEGHGEPPSSAAAEGHAAAAEPAPAPPPLSIHAETSVDRAFPDLPAPVPRDEAGAACLDAAALDLPGWGDERPFSEQLAERRAALLGEFDQPDPAAAEELVKLYLYEGFGAEARVAMTAFGVEPARRGLYAELADIMDYGAARQPGPLAGMTGCDTPAALWAVLSASVIDPRKPLDRGAVQRAFSALPLHLRRLVGPGLAQRFLAIGAEPMARSIRDAIDRAPGDHGAALQMIEARLDLAQGHAAAAETTLVGMVAGNGPMTAEAALLYADSRLAAHLPVDAQMVETLGALAFEHRKAADGPALARAHILALASQGDFAGAFAALDRRAGAVGRPGLRPVAQALFGMLVENPDDAAFLTYAFARQDDFARADPPAELRLAMAGRLVAEGFGAEARRVLGPAGGETTPGRLVLAEAALVEGDPATALAWLAAVSGPEAAMLEGRAQDMAGDHAAAAAAFARAGAAAEARAQTWRGGDWERVRSEGSAAQREVLALEAGPSAAEAEPSLAGADALLADSRTARAAWAALLADPGSGEAGHAAADPAAKDAAAPDPVAEAPH